MLGIQYAVQICVYLVIVVIILRRHVSYEIGTNVQCVALMAIAIGTALQALPKGPVGLLSYAVLQIIRLCRLRRLWEAKPTNRNRPLGLDCKITWLASRPIGKRSTEQLKFEV
jgi:hypothetical protein